jgi:FkbM family methyltransferase
MPEGSSLDPGIVIEAETDVGPILLEKNAVVVTREVLETGSYDAPVGRLLRQVLGPGSTMVDAGANVGYFTVLASQLVGPEGRVLAIEPDPLNLSILLANLERRECSNATVIPVAAWSERAELTILRQPTEGATARVGAGIPGGSPITAAPLDELIEGPVDCLKIDTELTDHHVVRGAKELISANPSMLVMVEFHPWHETHNGESPAEVLDSYRRLDLAPYEISETGLIQASWESIASPTLPDGHISLDFALSRELPERFLSEEARRAIASAQRSSSSA